MDQPLWYDLLPHITAPLADAPRTAFALLRVNRRFYNHYWRRYLHEAAARVALPTWWRPTMTEGDGAELATALALPCFDATYAHLEMTPWAIALGYRSHHDRYPAHLMRHDQVGQVIIDVLRAVLVPPSTHPTLITLIQAVPGRHHDLPDSSSPIETHEATVNLLPDLPARHEILVPAADTWSLVQCHVEYFKLPGNRYDHARPITSPPRGDLRYLIQLSKHDDPATHTDKKLPSFEPLTRPK